MAKFVVKGGGKKQMLLGTNAYIQLREEITKAGILDRSYDYYILLTLFVLGGFFVSIYKIFVTPLSIDLFLWTLVLSFFSVQIGGLMHDAGHRAIFSATTANNIFGSAVSFLINVSYNWWRPKHNEHHANPNQEDQDPDFALPLLSFTKDRFAKQKGIAKWLGKYQVYFYFPIGTLVVFTMRRNSFFYLKNNLSVAKIPEIIIFGIGFFVWFILPFLIFPLGKALVLFIILNAVSGVYMFNVFAPNHKGMPYLAKGVKFSFLEHQIMTTRNIQGSFLTDLIYMGLNYQIEHHLFPNCPRNKLKRITPYVLEICRRLNLEFTVVGVLESNKMILSELKQISSSNP